MKMKQAILKSKEIFVGLEDSKTTWKLCVRSNNMEVDITSMRADYAVLQAYFENRFPGCKIHVIYEAGFKGFGLYDKLISDGIDCKVIPPHLVTEAKVNRVKTDKRDARRLAKVLEHDDCDSYCNVPDKERREDRQVSRTMSGIKKDIKVYRNRIHGFLKFHGIAVPEKKSRWGKKDFQNLRKLSLSESLTLSLEMLLKTLEFLWDTEKQLMGKMMAFLKKERYASTIKIFQSMPGIGHLTAVRLVLEWGENLARFHSGKAIAAFIGLTGRENSTGEKVDRGGLTRLGNRLVRCWFVESAWMAIKKDRALLDKFMRVWSSSGKRKVAIVAVARMMAVRLRACVLSNTPYKLGVVQ